MVHQVRRYTDGQQKGGVALTFCDQIPPPVDVVTVRLDRVPRAQHAVLAQHQRGPSETGDLIRDRPDIEGRPKYSSLEPAERLLSTESRRLQFPHSDPW